MDELIYTIIAKELSGEATEAERAAIAGWLADDPANKTIYDDLAKGWNQTSLAAPEFNTSKAWDKLSSKINFEEAPVQAPVRKTISFQPFIKYAVGIAAVLMVGLFLINKNGNNTITVAAKDGNMTISLPDQSQVILKQGSTLHYPEQFAANERNIKLEGEAFFEVMRNEKQPFIIDAQSVAVKVLGTSFNVKSSPEQATVVVKTGKVQMKDQGSKEYLILTPGERGMLRSSKLTEDKVSVDNYLFWNTGKISFDAVALTEVVNTLSEVTDTTVTLADGMPALQSNQLVNISFTKQPVADMVNELCLITKCDWEKKGDTYIIKGK